MSPTSTRPGRSAWPWKPRWPRRSSGARPRSAPRPCPPPRSAEGRDGMRPGPWIAPLMSTSAVIVLRVSSIAAGLVYIKLYTHLLTPEEVGVFFYLTALSYVLNALV